METDLTLLLLDMPKSLRGKAKVKKDNVPKRLEQHKKTIAAYLEGQKKVAFKPEFTIKDFSSVREAALHGIDIEDITKLPLHDGTKDSLLVASTEFNGKLSNEIPVNLSQTLFGVDERDPSDYEKSKFIRAMRVIENPDHIFELLGAGLLSGHEIDILKDYYPAYYQNLVDSVLEVISELQGNRDTELTPTQNRDLALILGVPRVKPDILSMESPEEEEPGADVGNPDASKTEVQAVLEP